MNNARVAFVWTSGNATYTGIPFEKASQYEVELHAERLYHALATEKKRVKALERRVREMSATLFAICGEEETLP